MRLAASREPSPTRETMAFGLTAIVVEVEAAQVASFVDERDGVEERSVHVLRGTTIEESNIVNEGNFGDVVPGRRNA